MTLFIILILTAILATFAARVDDPNLFQSRKGRIRLIAFWLFTLIVALEMTAGALWDLLQIEFTRVSLTRLGYPLYVSFIIGIWKIPCALTLLLPRFPRLKEWAYAGAFFDYTGAIASQLFAGHGAKDWIPPLLLAGFTLASWAFRPPTRRLELAAPPIKTRAIAWLVPMLIFIVLLISSFLTLPKGAPN